jgi:hydrogenase maturation protein HypF
VKIKAYKIQISGRVQGVGFRPFVYNLATKHLLCGTVSNNANGVVIYINTSEQKAALFLNNLLKKIPKVAIIENYSINESTFKKYTDFKIIPSRAGKQVHIPLTPDFAVCNACKNEINDKNNKRYNYAFTTCVHCGPRYAVTKKYPFERKNTTLSKFKMCKCCKEEYSNPVDRRFHSQTNSCSDCGVKMTITNNIGNTIEINQDKIISKISSLIAKGYIVGIKNTNGYLLCCDATNPKAIKKLRKRKNRFNKPFAVLYPSLYKIKEEFDITPTETEALQSIVAPIVILNNSKRIKFNTQAVAPNLNQTGVMLPTSALMQLIMQKIGKPIIATSGNAHGSPIITNQEDAELKLKNIADYFLHHNLEIEFPQDDSVVKFVLDKPIWIRRSRGLAPNYLIKKRLVKKQVLAMGSNLKSTFSFIPNKHIYLSQYFGNLDNFDVIGRFKSTLEKYINLFNTRPKTILIDKHIQYQSSMLGKAYSKIWKTNLIEIQHHKAHFCSVLGEHQLFDTSQKILGVIWDGTGLGDDYQIWEGEFFIYKNKQITRINHFEYFNWLANDKMAREPRLSLFSLLDKEDRNFIKEKFTKTECTVYDKMLKSNHLKTSSVGRLFDAVASLLDIVDVNSYDAEAPMLLENCAKKYQFKNRIDFLENENYDNIPTKLIIKKIIEAINKDLPKEYIAFNFMYTLAKVIVNSALKNEVQIITCSGGVFQNSMLVKLLTSLAIENQLELKINRKLPANDENTSFGQLMYFQNIKN